MSSIVLSVCIFLLYSSLIVPLRLRWLDENFLRILFRAFRRNGLNPLLHFSENLNRVPAMWENALWEKKTIRNCLNRQKKKRKGKTSSLANCRGFFPGHFAAERKVERQGCIFHFSFFEVPILIFFLQTTSGVGNVERKPFSSFSDFPLKWQK